MRIQRRSLVNHSKYHNPENLDMVVENDVGKIQDLPSRQWVHILWYRKFKRPECGDHKRNQNN